MKNFLLFFLGIIIISNAYSQGTGDYRSKTSGLWNAASSWERYNGSSWVSATTAPSSSDKVITIRNGHTITINSNVSIDQVIVGAGGTLIISYNTTTLNNGSGDDLSVEGTLKFSGGTINGTGTMKIMSAFLWSGGTLSAATSLQSGSTTTIDGSVVLSNSLTNNSIINWNDGYFTFNGGTLNNNKTFNANGNNYLYYSGAGGTFNNKSTGTFTKQTGTGNTTNNITFNNDGTMNFKSGVFYNGGVLVNTSSLKFAGGTFRNGATATFNAGTSVSGNGTFIQYYNTLSINVNLDIPSTVAVTINNGTISGTGSVKINGSLLWDGGTVSLPTTLQSGSTTTIDGSVVLSSSLTNNSTVNWNDGYFTFNGGTLNNNKTFNANGNNYLYYSGAGGTFNNKSTGTFTKQTGTGNTTNNITFNNDGTMSFKSGVFYNGGVLVNTSSLKFAGGTFRNGATATFNAGTSVSGNGTFIQYYNTLSVNVNLDIPSTVAVTINNGTISGTGSVKINGSLLWDGGTVSLPTTLQSGSTTTIAGSVVLSSSLTNNSTVNWNDGYFTFNGGTLNNNKTFNANGNNYLYYSGAGGTFNNKSTGTFTKQTGTGNTTNNITFNNDGTMSFKSGVFYNGGVLVNTSSLKFAGGTFRNGATATFNAGTSVSGNGTFIQYYNTLSINVNLDIPSTVAVTINNGTISGTGSVKINGSLLWDGGTVSLPTTLQSGSTTTIAGSVVLSSSLANNSTVNWNDGYFTFNGGTFFNNKNFNVNGNNTLYYSGAGGTFNNQSNGIFSKSSTGVTAVNIPFINSGKIQGNGTLSFGNNLTNKGVFAPGNPIGILTVGTNYINKKLEIQMKNGSGAGTGNDKLVVNGNVTLGTPLEIIRTGIVPKGTYTILSCTGVISGKFKKVIAPDGYKIVQSGKEMLVKVPDPFVSINDTFVTEGNSGTKKIKFVVSLAYPSNVTTTVNYQTANGTATTGNNDYVAASGTLTFASGQVTDTIEITIKGDKQTEPDEYFYVNLSNPNRLVLKKAQGKGTIKNDDGSAKNSVEQLQVNNGQISAPVIIPNLVKRSEQWKIQGLNNFRNSVTVADVNGIVVLKIDNYQTDADVSKLTPGIYFYRIIKKEKDEILNVYNGKMMITE